MHFPFQDFAGFRWTGRQILTPAIVLRWAYSTTARTFQTYLSGGADELGTYAASLPVPMAGVDASLTPPIRLGTNAFNCISAYFKPIQRTQDELMMHVTLREGVAAAKIALEPC